MDFFFFSDLFNFVIITAIVIMIIAVILVELVEEVCQLHQIECWYFSNLLVRLSQDQVDISSHHYQLVYHISHFEQFCFLNPLFDFILLEV